MSFSFSSIAAGFVFGVIGMYLLNRARRVAHVPSFVFGIALLVYPYFIENDYLLWGIGPAILVLAYRFRH